MLGCNNEMLIDLVGYQLDDIAHHWYVQHVERRPAAMTPLTWDEFQQDLIDRFLPPCVRDAKAQEFEQLK